MRSEDSPGRETQELGAKLQPDLLAQVLRQLSEGRSWPSLLEQHPELSSPQGQAGLRRAAYILEQATLEDDSWLLSELIEHIPEMIFVKEASDLRFVRLNQAAEKLMGFRREEMLGKTDFDFFPENEASFFQSKDREVLQSHKLLDIPREEILTRNGPRLLHTQKIPILDDQGQPRYLAGISRDITAFCQAQEEISRTQAQLRRLSAKLQQAEEEERRRLAREIHDELGQILTGLKIELGWIANHLPDGRTDLENHLDQALNLADSALTTVRRVATELRPQLLDDLGLKAALDWLLQESSSRAHLASSLHFQVPRKLDKSLSTTVFRVCQEALTNVLRHADASRVRLDIQEVSGCLRVCIEDDGVGFNPQQPNGNNLGLVGIRERVLLHGGEMTVQSRPDIAGTTLTLQIPLPKE